MKNYLLTIILIVSLLACNKVNTKQWNPRIVLMKDGENISKIDTLISGTIYERNLVTIPKSFTNDQGNEIIRSNQNMKLKIGLDTFPEGVRPEFILINKYLTQKGNQAEISIPVDSLVSEFDLKDSIIWTIEARIIDDSLYIEGGTWFIKK
jgi:hypothetical protein